VSRVGTKKLLLIDGANLLCQAFFGVPERLLPDGRPVQGVIGFVGIMVKIIRETEPTHILVVFDPEEKSSRVDMYPQYKQNRQDFGDKPDRENPFTQLADVKRALDGLGIRYVEQLGCEADDMIASHAAQSGCEVVIASSDTDFLQLVTEKVTVFRYRGQRSILFDEEMVRKRYGVHPSRFLEYKALVGDNSDNVEGVRGIGPKTAIRVIDGERELNRDEREVFERNLSVIALDTGISLPHSLRELPMCHDFQGFRVGVFLKSLTIL